MDGCVVCLTAGSRERVAWITFLPEEKDAFDRDVNFTTTLFTPTMGHTTFYTGIFNSAQSTLPLTCEITDMMHYDGTPAPNWKSIIRCVYGKNHIWVQSNQLMRLMPNGVRNIVVCSMSVRTVEK